MTSLLIATMSEMTQDAMHHANTCSMQDATEQAVALDLSG